MSEAAYRNTCNSQRVQKDNLMMFSERFDAGTLDILPVDSSTKLPFAAAKLLIKPPPDMVGFAVDTSPSHVRRSDSERLSASCLTASRWGVAWDGTLSNVF